MRFIKFSLREVSQYIMAQTLIIETEQCKRCQQFLGTNNHTNKTVYFLYFDYAETDPSIQIVDYLLESNNLSSLKF